VACEALIAAASKKDKATSILNQGVTILKKLYQIGNDNIKVLVWFSVLINRCILIVGCISTWGL